MVADQTILFLIQEEILVEVKDISISRINIHYFVFDHDFYYKDIRVARVKAFDTDITWIEFLW